VNGSVCVQFRARTSTDQYYIRIVNGDGCSSYVGMNAGVQMERTVTLQSSGCLSNGTIMHELYHTLGFYHEQSRPDRDDYITVNYANIQSGMASQFQKYDDSTTNTYNYPYDYTSVMHYSAYAFSANNLPTITPRENVTLGQRNTLSTNDIRVLRLLYNCSANGVTIPTPTAQTTVNIYTVNTTARTSLTTSSSRFTRYSGDTGNYYFQAFQVTVPSSGPYRFASMSNVDTYGYLYSTSFTPQSPAYNLIAFDDDTASNNQFQITMSLQSTTNYILVVTTYAVDTTADITVLVSGLTGVTITPLTINANTTTQSPPTTSNNTNSVSYSSTLSSSSSTFTRSGASGMFYFEAIQISVTTTGTYIFQSGSNFDDYGYLYQTSFNPSNPGSNIVTSDDDSGGSSRFRFSITLQAGTTYILIITTYNSDATGSISVTVSGPARVTLTRLNVGSGSTVASTSTVRTTTVAPLTSSYASTLSSNSSTFTRSGSTGTFYFEAIQVSITTPGTYTFQSGSTMDDFGYLYQTSFNPSNPGSNVIASDDDSGGSYNFRFTATLQTTTTYILVITTYSSGATGSISVTVGGPARATLTRLSIGSGSTVAITTTVPTSTIAPAASIYSSTLAIGSSTFTRSGATGSFYFEAIQVSVTTTGTYIFQSGSNFDDYGYLYQTSFNPSNPVSNIVTSDDDSGGSARFQFSATLQAGTTYILVITTYSSGATGSISVTVSGPVRATLTRLTVGSGSNISSTTTVRPTTVGSFSSSYSSTLSSSSSTFTRSGSSGIFYFEAIQVSITTTGTYIFQSGSSFDDYGYLYQTSFDSSNSGINLFTSDDDSGGSSRFRFSISLQAGTTYILVITTYSSGATGSISVTVSGPAQPSLTRLTVGSASTTPSTTTVQTTTAAPRSSSYSSTLATGSSTFTRSGATGSFYFEAIQVSVSTTGTYTFQSGSSFDDFGYLYQTSFNPSSSGINVIASDDDSGGSARFRFSATLQAGTTYILVITTYSSSATGSISVTVSGPAQPSLTRLTVGSASTAPTTTTARPTTTSLVTVTYTSTLTSSSSRFTRSGASGTFFYEAVQVTIPTNGIYTFLSGSSIDDYGYLYQTSFSAASPGSNILTSDDDSGGAARFRFSISLQAARTYILVITTYGTSATGGISVSVAGPGRVTLTRITTASSSG